MIQEQAATDPKFVNGKILDLEHGLVGRRVYADEPIYRQEMERVFRKCWLFVGHESMVPKAGDYVTTYMGQDPVIVWRDVHGRVRVFLNTCPHRGNAVCPYDEGRAASLSCSYHGWTFDTEGKLVGIPFLDEAYYGELDRENWGLVEIPKLASYGGLIFASWDSGAEPLADYLGELRWYLDNVLLVDDMGELEVIPGCQRYAIVGNWKFFCDNFAGDGYHVPTSHASVFATGGTRSNYSERKTRGGLHMIHAGPAHTLGAVSTTSSEYEADLAQAQAFGPEVVEYVEERRRRQVERLKASAVKPYGWTWGHIFPNLNLQAFNTAFRSKILAVCQPRGPQASEIWQWNFIERAAPRAVKEWAARTANQGQSGTGIIGVDDCENFERITEAWGPTSEQLTFHYAMALRHEGHWPDREEWNVDGLAGIIGPRMSETGQRRFYTYWAKLMGIPSA